MTLSSISGTLQPTAPFDFMQTLKFIGMFMPGHNEQSLDGISCIKALPINGRAVVAKVSSTATIEQPMLEYVFYSEAPLNNADKEATLDRLRFYLSLNDDLRAFYAIGKDDPQFAPILDKLYGLHQVKFVTPFENTCWAILSQRTYMNVARKVKDALTEQLGSSLEVDGAIYRVFPEAEQLLTIGDDTLNAIVRNERKTECLISAAQAFASVDEAWLRTAEIDAVNEWLRKIKGIGVWSSSFVLLRGLGRTERIPKDDQRLAQAAQKFYGTDDLAPLAAAYGKWQGYWAYYLRVAS
jgi:DNA-3-methyladenine glycosylase II